MEEISPWPYLISFCFFIVCYLLLILLQSGFWERKHYTSPARGAMITAVLLTIVVFIVVAL